MPGRDAQFVKRRIINFPTDLAYISLETIKTISSCF